jgi:hypothetical protein
MARTKTAEPRAQGPKYNLLLEAVVNGKVGTALARFADESGKTVHSDRVKCDDDKDRRRMARAAARKLNVPLETLEPQVEERCHAFLDDCRRRREEADAGSGGAESAESAGFQQYRVVRGRLCKMCHARDGDPYPMPLCNFDAWVTREEVLDDGSGEDRYTFDVEGKLDDGTPLGSRTVPGAEFAAMNWPLRVWGLGAVVQAGASIKDNLRVAVQERSKGAERVRIFKHTGWRKVGGERDGSWAYLHAGGAITSGGLITAVAVDLEGSLALFRLPPPPTGSDLVRAVAADLDLLQLLPRMMYALVGAAYRAVLGAADFSLALIGPTGLGKSELASLMQRHFGVDMSRLRLPGNWSSTANALESLAFLAKDAPLVIDEFKPRGSRSEIEGMHGKSERVLQAQGNNSARGRCWADGSPRPPRPPRGLIVSTGEEQFRTESLRARVLPLFVRRGELDVGEKKLHRLTPYQAAAARGLYAQAMSGFLQWLAPRLDDIHDRQKDEHAALRDRALQSGDHPRTPGIVADLALGLKYFFGFAVDCGALTKKRRGELARDAWGALIAAGQDQQVEVAAQDPARRFLELLAAAITSERAHLAGPGGGPPPNHLAWGWRDVEVPSGDGIQTRTDAKGNLVGWVDKDDLYLDPEASYAAAMRLGEDQGERLALSQRQLGRRLKEQGLLASARGDRDTVSRTLQSRKREVLHLRARDLIPPAENADPGPTPPLWGNRHFRHFRHR